MCLMDASTDGRHLSPPPPSPLLGAISRDPSSVSALMLGQDRDASCKSSFDPLERDNPPRLSVPELLQVTLSGDFRAFTPAISSFTDNSNSMTATSSDSTIASFFASPKTRSNRRTVGFAGTRSCLAKGCFFARKCHRAMALED